MQTEDWKWFVLYHLSSEPVTWITKERNFSQSIDSSNQNKKYNYDLSTQFKRIYLSERKGGKEKYRAKFHF